jgi:hypothetical protein
MSWRCEWLWSPVVRLGELGVLTVGLGGAGSPALCGITVSPVREIRDGCSERRRYRLEALRGEDCGGPSARAWTAAAGVQDGGGLAGGRDRMWVVGCVRGEGGFAGDVFLL